MSGIVAVVNRDRAPVDRALLQRMTSWLARNAPDGERDWVGDGVGLGHALLATSTESIVVPRPASLDGRVWITADARIDGRNELVRSLKAHGLRVTPDAGDDQLILHAYRAWGEACAKHLIGDFAFAIWDAELERLFCARDQFGVTPLYYATPPTGVVLSNSVLAILGHPGVSGELDERVIADFLLLGANMDVRATTFAAIRALEPAHTLTWTDGAVELRRYWSLAQEAEHIDQRPSQDHVERFARVFEQAVGDRVRPSAIGAQLSGGLDSTSIAVTAHKLMTAKGLPFDLRAYTVVFEWLIAEEERRYADQVATSVGLPIEYVVAEDYMTRPPEEDPAWVLAEPWGIAERSQDYEVMRRVAAFAPVMLTGLGGDPLLAAPSRPPSGWRGMAHAAARDIVTGRVPRFGLRTAVKSRLGRSSAGWAPDWINPTFARRVDLDARAHEIESLLRATSTRESMLSPFWVDLFRSSHGGALGLPIRVVFPFFDVRLVRCVLETPRIPWRVDKRLLREAMRGMLPEAVRLRPKTSLYRPGSETDESHPVYRLWRGADARHWREELIRTPAIAEFVDVQRALALVEAVPKNSLMLLTFERCFPVAHWLQHRPDSGTFASGLGSLSRSSDVRGSVSYDGDVQRDRVR